MQIDFGEATRWRRSHLLTRQIWIFILPALRNKIGGLPGRRFFPPLRWPGRHCRNLFASCDRGLGKRLAD